VRFYPLLLMLACAPALGGHAQTNVSPAAHDSSSGSPAPPQVAQAVVEAEALIVKAEWKTAEAKLAGWLTSNPEDARALFDAGYAADALNNLDDAAGYYSRAVKADPKSFEARISLGLLLARQGKVEEARPELAAATELDPGDAGPAVKARAWRALAQIDRAKDPAAASNDLLEALKLTPETPRDTLLAAELADATNQPDSAEAAYRRVLAKDAKNTEANAGLGHLLIARKQYPEAETLLRAALEQMPDDLALTAELATVLAAQDKAEALPLLQKLHDAHPQDENVTRMLAEVLDEAGDASGSDHYYSALLAAHPDDPALLISHGENLLRQLKYSEAFQAFSKATELDPKDGNGWSGLAFAASKTEQPSIALHALTVRSKIIPDTPSTYFLWATSYDMLRDRQAAITYYHLFLNSAAGKFPDQEWQARQRLLVLEKKP
jgi:tetratricopeptide (TPR) repeat protein